MRLQYLLSVLLLSGVVFAQDSPTSAIGREVAIERHLQDGEEFQIGITDLIEFGKRLFTANWTVQEGGGRPMSKGTGDPLSNPAKPLVFPRNFNRISAPEANSCAGCHNVPFVGGGGDIVANVFVLGQRFDSISFDSNDPVATGSSMDELGRPVTLQTVANSRNTLGMFGSGFIEMLARQITADLQGIRNGVPPGGSKALSSKGISFGSISRNADGSWDVSKVDGLPATSLATTGSADPPSLIIRPFHQAGRVISLREFTNNAFNHHHGMQSTERFGIGTDPDGDGVVNELTRADITASVVFQATLPVPGRVIPTDLDTQKAIRLGEDRFTAFGCAGCHVPLLPLDKEGWIYTEPNPYNVTGNLRPGEASTLSVDLTSDELPQPRLKPDKDGIVWVPAYTDFKLHDICSGPGDPNGEPLDMQAKPGSAAFFAGNRLFLTRKLWGTANEPPFFHHGQYTTMREAVLAHAGEALKSRQAFGAATGSERDAVIAFLKTLQVLPPGARELVVYKTNSGPKPSAAAHK
jgi:Di-haem oxidoreductase, putative peroxidase